MAKQAAKAKVPPAATESKKTISMSAAQQKLVDGLKTVSARIRYLNDEGFSRSEITKLITNATGGQLRYQHVRNVLTSQAPKIK